jgi:hypothetical protein
MASYHERSSIFWVVAFYLLSKIDSIPLILAAILEVV